MKGHLSKRPGKNGDAWRIHIDLPKGEDGKRRQKTCTFHGTKGEAEAKLRELLHQVDKGIYADSGKQTVRTFLLEWLKSVEASIAPTTYERYADLVHRHIVPAIGHHKLSLLTPQHVSNYYRKALKEGRLDGSGGLSAKTVLQIHRVLHRALKTALKWGLVARNVADAVDSPKAKSAEREVLTMDEVKLLLEEAKKSRYYPQIMLALTTGMRRGEILGLKWDDIDFGAGTIAVRRSLEQTRSGLQFKCPKSGKVRVIKLPSIAIQVLKELKTSSIDSELVCCNKQGEPMKPDSFSSDWRYVRENAGVKAVTFHDLRHTHATMLLLAGTHIKVVSSRLGHSTIAITGDLYTHVLPTMETEVADKLDDLLAGNEKGRM